jgi:hypothetical protein
MAQGSAEHRKGVIHMTYANLEEHSSLIVGLRDLADFLEENPEVPAPRWADVLVFPPDGTDKEMKTEIERVAILIDGTVSDQAADNGHYTASRKFGPVQYRAVAIPARWQARRAENDIVPRNDDEGA